VANHIGREEERLLASLRARGHDVSPQWRVWQENAYGWFDIDIAFAPIAIEIQTAPEKPWTANKLNWRTVYLISKGWRMIYLWLPKGAIFTEDAVDAILRFRLDVENRSVHTYRCIDCNGKTLQVGWTTQTGRLMCGDPEPVAAPEIEPEQPTLEYQGAPEPIDLDESW
jgi:hypothetical protein